MEGHYGNAMTEIALALAMAFFSVMVLAMVSMGAGSGDAGQQAAVETLKVVPSAPASQAQPAVANAKIVVYYQDRYLDDQLQPVDPNGFSADQPIILAIDPDLSLSGALEARSAITTTNITVTTLDPRWMRTLKETSK